MCSLLRHKLYGTLLLSRFRSFLGSLGRIEAPDLPPPSPLLQLGIAAGTSTPMVVCRKPLVSLSCTRSAQRWPSGAILPPYLPQIKRWRAPAGEHWLCKPSPCAGASLAAAQVCPVPRAWRSIGDNTSVCFQYQPLLGNTLLFLWLETLVTTGKKMSFQPHL